MMMKWIVAVFLCAGLFAAEPEKSEWLTDLLTAQAQAKAENKRILLLFTGSDWCVNCVKWDKEVFHTPEFRDYAKINFVLTMIDFPDRKKLPKKQERANDRLKDQFKVTEYPLACVLDSKGKELGRFQYSEGGFAKFKKQVEAIH
jgi:thioredoxin-related protein